MAEIIPFDPAQRNIPQQLSLDGVMAEGEVEKAFEEPDQDIDPDPAATSPNPVVSLAVKRGLNTSSEDESSIHEDTGYGDLLGKRIARSVKQIGQGVEDIQTAADRPLEGHGWQRLHTALDAITEISRYRPNETAMFEAGYQAPKSSGLTQARAERIVRSDALNKLAAHVENRIEAKEDKSVAGVMITSVARELFGNEGASAAYDFVLDGMQDFFEIYRLKPTETASQVMRRFSDMLARQAGLNSRNLKDMPIGLIDQAWNMTGSDPLPPISA